MIDLT